MSLIKLLKHLFESTESIAKEIELNDENIIKHWKEYRSTISRKKDIINKLGLDNNLQRSLQELIKLLKFELVDISSEEKEESEIISDLEAIEHSKKIKRIHRLEDCLVYAETRHEYAYELLYQLHSILNSQMHLVIKLQNGAKNTEKLISHLKSQFELEITILNKIEKIEEFHNLFLALIKGGHIIRTMDAKEKKLLKKMKSGVSKIFSTEINEGITYEWAMTVFNAVQDIVMDHEAIIAKGFDPHSNVDFEFVNRAEFINLVKESIQNLKKRKISEQIINVFIHLFREWYNHERD